MEITLTLPVPPSVNKAYGNRRGNGRGRFKTRVYLDWETEAFLALMKQEWPKFSYPVAISYVVPVNRRRDLDNHFKLLNDLLVKNEVIDDDRSKYVQQLSIRENVRDDVLVTIEELCP